MTAQKTPARTLYLALLLRGEAVALGVRHFFAAVRSRLSPGTCGMFSKNLAHAQITFLEQLENTVPDADGFLQRCVCPSVVGIGKITGK